MCGKVIFAHEVNVAYFNFTIKENRIEVEAEFPWTMRNTLLDFNPQLEHSTDKQDFEKTFVEYIKKNLVLKDQNGTVLELVQVRELPKKGHSHQNNYLLEFNGRNLDEVTNTFMFNLYKNQVNYNNVEIENMSKTYKTRPNATSFSIKKTSQISYWYLSLLIIPCAIVVKRFSEKQTSDNKVYK